MANEEVKQTLQDTLDTVKKRISGPFTGPFIISWVAINWRLILYLFFGSEGMSDKIYAVDFNTFEIFNKQVEWAGIISFFILPLVTSFLLILIFKLMNVFVEGMLARIDIKFGPWVEIINTIQEESDKKIQLFSNYNILKNKADAEGLRNEKSSNDKQNTISDDDVERLKGNLPKRSIGLRPQPKNSLNEYTKKDLEGFYNFCDHSPVFPTFKKYLAEVKENTEWQLVKDIGEYLNFTMNTPKLVDIESVNFEHKTYFFIRFSDLGITYKNMLELMQKK